MTRTVTDAADPVEQQATPLSTWLNEQLDAIETRQLRRTRLTTNSLPHGWCERDGRRLLNFASNDYLDLSHAPEVVEAFTRAASQSAGAGASALITGRSQWHERLEETIARFEGTEAAVLFPSGYAANLGTISALTGPADAIFSDELNHASLIDGCRLSRAEVHIYPNRDVTRLAELLEQTPAQRRLIVTDAVFSMDGTIAPLTELTALAEHHHCDVLVDEAHGTGVIGHHGRGGAAACGVESRIAVRMGTLSKAIGCCGGFVAGSRDLIEWLWNRARTQFFSTALPPAVCAAATAAFGIIDSDPSRREALHARVAQLRDGLALMGCSPGSGDVPIVPVIIGEADAALEVSTQLAEAGFLVPAIRPPTVPPGTARLRISLSSGHSVEAVDQLLAALDRFLPTSTRGRRD